MTDTWKVCVWSEWSNYTVLHLINTEWETSTVQSSSGLASHIVIINKDDFSFCVCLCFYWILQTCTPNVNFKSVTMWNGSLTTKIQIRVQCVQALNFSVFWQTLFLQQTDIELLLLLLSSLGFSLPLLKCRGHLLRVLLRHLLPTHKHTSFS